MSNVDREKSSALHGVPGTQTEEPLLHVLLTAPREERGRALEGRTSEFMAPAWKWPITIQLANDGPELVAGTSHQAARERGRDMGRIWISTSTRRSWAHVIPLSRLITITSRDWESEKGLAIPGQHGATRQPILGLGLPRSWAKLRRIYVIVWLHPLINSASSPFPVGDTHPSLTHALCPNLPQLRLVHLAQDNVKSVHTLWMSPLDFMEDFLHLLY